MQLNSDISSAEIHNFIDASLHGEATFIFNSTNSQELFSFQPVEFHNVSIHNSSQFTFQSPVIINGNLKLDMATIYVMTSLVLKGELLKDAQSLIVGEDLIIRSSQVKQPISTPLHIPQPVLN